MREVRVRLVQRSLERRSPDLEQDYDPETNTLHRAQGVLIVTARREYFFPSDWIEHREYGRVQRLVSEIRDALS